MKKNAVVILLITLLSLCILIGGVLLVIFLDINGSSKDNESVEDNPNTEEMYQFSLDSSIVTNIKDSKKCVRCKIVLQLSDYTESEKLNNESYKVNDLIIEVLRKTEESEYRKDDIQEILESEIKEEIEKELRIKSITKVYFSEFITQ